jgi:hypothetical protein
MLDSEKINDGAWKTSKQGRGDVPEHEECSKKLLESFFYSILSILCVYPQVVLVDSALFGQRGAHQAKFVVKSFLVVKSF